VSDFLEYPLQGLVLACPGCGSNFTHLRGVEFQGGGEICAASSVLPGEDVDLEGALFWPGAHLSGGYPVEARSPRRDSVMLVFDCEGCEVLFGLYFSQHKGETFTGAVALPGRRDA